MSSEFWLERYVAGDCQTVWGEILTATSAGKVGDRNPEIRGVVKEVMRRARQNIEVIIQRLHDSGYEFVDPSSKGYLPRLPLVRPNEDSPDFAFWLGQLVGPLPLTIIEWIETVGDVNLVGNHPEWPEIDMITDALVVEFELSGYADRGPGWDAKEYYQNELETWRADVAEYGQKEIGPFLLTFAPDAYHKANVSGGGPYGIYLPDGSIDATCRINGREISFVDYLRECFASGGFPGAPSLPQIPSLRHALLPI
jgi:hypothetical protein